MPAATAGAPGGGWLPAPPAPPVPSSPLAARAAQRGASAAQCGSIWRPWPKVWTLVADNVAPVSHNVAPVPRNVTSVADLSLFARTLWSFQRRGRGQAL